jgi:hypothetical protein
MKPMAKKGLMVIVALYAVTVGLMIANFLERAEPKHHEEVMQRVQDDHNQSLA